MSLIISEVFTSIQGETTQSGMVSVFVRLAGCNLSCRFCDTEYARSGGAAMSVDTIIGMIRAAGNVHHVTITGGEPLSQEGTGDLVARCIELGYRVRIETNGSIDISVVPPPAQRIIDVKTPSSGEADSFCMKNLDQLTDSDEIKFVVSDEKDLNFTYDFYAQHLSGTKAVINISPAANTMSYAECADFIIKRIPSARLNIQLHKVVWPQGEPK